MNAPDPAGSTTLPAALPAVGPGLRAKLTLIASLYVSQAIPLGFLLVAMPVILRDAGVSLEVIGLLSAVSLPWLLKFLWAPLVDRWGSARRGHFVSWIVPLQGLSVLSMLGLASLDLPADLSLAIGLAAFFMLLASTQDIATDGLAVRILGAGERGVANGIQVGGFYLGQVLGGGILLVAFSHFGWTTSLILLAVVLSSPLWAIGRFVEPPAPATAGPRRLDYPALGRFVRRTGWAWIVLVLIFRTGEAMASYSFKLMLVDLGLELGDIGLFVGVLYSVAALGGALVGGLVTSRWGRRRSLLVFGLAQSLAILLYAVPGLGMEQLVWVVTAVVVVAGTGGMATAALFTAMMDHADPRTAATDFTVQQSLCALGPMVGAAASGFSATHLGFSGHFVLSAGISLLGVVLVVPVRLSDPGASADG